MNDRLHPSSVVRLDDVPCQARAHWSLLIYAAVLRLLGEAVHRFGGLEPLLQRHPVAAVYLDEVAQRGLDGQPLPQALHSWCAALREWATQAPLPLHRLPLDEDELQLLALLGLAEEDPGLGALLTELQGEGAHRLVRCGAVGAGALRRARRSAAAAASGAGRSCGGAGPVATSTTAVAAAA